MSVTALTPTEAAPVRVAVVGTGWWGTEHARAFAVCPDAELVAVAGRDPERTLARGRQFGVPGYVDLDAMAEREDPDLVAVAVDRANHHPVALRLLRAGRRVFLEKPLAQTVAEADELIAAAAQGAGFLAVDFNYRYARPVRLAREAIAAGRLGRPALAVWQLSGECGEGEPYRNLVETQCHGFDLLEQLCGPIVAVSAELTEEGSPGRFDTMAVGLRFASGAVGSLLSTGAAAYSYPGAQSLTLTGTAGRITIEDTVRRFTLAERGCETVSAWESGFFDDLDRSFMHTLDAHVADVVAAVRAGRPPPVPGEAGRRAVLLAEAVATSHRLGRRVEIAAEV